jgi:protein gp37
MNKSKIEWCDFTWNPVTGCLHDCPYCYARNIVYRFGNLDCGTSQTTLKKPFIINRLNGEKKRINFPAGFSPTFHRYRLDEPQKFKKPQNIFVCSIADLFGEWVSDEWIQAVFEACEKAPQHRYLFLTKNPKRYIELAKKNILPRRHWYGYTATAENELWRVTHADDCPCINLFISIEPIIEQFSFDVTTHCPADWIIIGKETGSRKDKVIPKREWIEGIVKYNNLRVPVFMKNNLKEIWGGPLIQEYPWKEAVKQYG